VRCFPVNRRLLLLAVVLQSAYLTACREMPRTEYVALLTEANDSLTAKQERLRAEFQLGTHPRFDWDQRAGLIVFSDHDTARVIARIQFVGSIATRDSTWLWAWSNETVEPSMQRAARSARWFGWRHGIRYLTDAHWAADPIDGWEMTILTAWITNASGAYRVPNSDSSGYTYLLLNDVVRAKPGTLVSSLISRGPT
jgi:hypothetical protein